MEGLAEQPLYAGMVWPALVLGFWFVAIYALVVWRLARRAA